MKTLNAGDALGAELSKISQPTEIHDSQGNVIGFFTPATDRRAVLYQRAAAHFDAAQMKRRKRSSRKGGTTREVLKRLKTLKDA